MSYYGRFSQKQSKNVFKAGLLVSNKNIVKMVHFTE